MLKQRKSLGIELPVIGNPSTVAATTVANLTAEEADGAYGIGGMLPQVSSDPKVQAFARQVLEQDQGAARQLRGRLPRRHVPGQAR